MSPVDRVKAWKHLHNWSMPSLLRQIIHILSFYLVASDFVVNWIRSRLFGGHNLEVHMDDHDLSDYYVPPLIGRGIKRHFSLTSVCRLSVAYMGPKSRTERPRKTKIGAEVAHVTWLRHRFAHGRVGASGSCSGGRENVLTVGNCCYVAVCSAAQSASVPTGAGEGWGHTVAPAGYSLLQFWSAGSEWCTVRQGRHRSWKRSRPADSIRNDNVILQHI